MFPMPIPGTLIQYAVKAATFAPRLAALLDTPAVREINFRFGHVHIRSAHFGVVSNALISGKLKVAIASGNLSADSDAEYDPGSNTFEIPSPFMLDSKVGRGTAVHEATHAIADHRKGTTAELSEEAAAFIAEAWYHLAAHDEATAVQGTNRAFTDIAKAMRGRAKAGGPMVRASADEINGGRRAARTRGYEAGFYANDGF